MWDEENETPAASPYAEDLADLRAALAEATARLALLERVRAMLCEHDGDETLLTLFSALLDQASEIRAEADRLSDELALLEDELSDAVWTASRHAG